LNKEIFSEELLGDMSVTPRTSDISKKYNLFNLPTDRQLTSDEKDLLRQQVDLLNKITQLPDSLALNKQLSAGIVSAIEKIHGGIEHVGVSLIKLSQESLWNGDFVKANFLTRLSAEVSEKLALALFKGPLKGTASAGKFLVRAALEPVDSVVKPLGNIADLIGKLEAAADLLETNPKAASEMYDKISRDLDPVFDATVQYFKATTWGQILEDGIAVGTEFWLTGKAIGEGFRLAGEGASALTQSQIAQKISQGIKQNFSGLLERGLNWEDALAQICYDVGAPIPAELRAIIESSPSRVDAVNKFIDAVDRIAQSGIARTEQTATTISEGAIVTHVAEQATEKSKYWHPDYVENLSDSQMLLGIRTSGKGSTTLGSASHAEAWQAGKAWVGGNAQPIYESGQLIGYSSADKFRVFRLHFKPKDGMIRANFQDFISNPLRNGKTTEIKNVHIDILD